MKIPNEYRIPFIVFSIQLAMLGGLALIFLVLHPG